MKKNIDNTKIEVLPDSYKYVAELIGLESALAIIKHFGGSTIYVPKIDSYNRRNRNIMIVNDYKTGLSYNQLATKYDLTDVSVRNIIASCL